MHFLKQGGDLFQCLQVVFQIGAQQAQHEVVVQCVEAFGQFATQFQIEAHLESIADDVDGLGNGFAPGGNPVLLHGCAGIADCRLGAREQQQNQAVWVGHLDGCVDTHLLIS